MSRVFKTRKNQITQIYKPGRHFGIDLVGYKYALDYIVAHSDGVVVGIDKSVKYNLPKSRSYGNYVKIRHNNGMYTLYAHLKYGSVNVNKGDKVKKGQVIGYMGNTGHSFGAHLHFEVRNTSDKKINPTPYIDADLPNNRKEDVIMLPNRGYFIKNDRGENVKLLQAFLNFDLSNNIGIDGIIGNATINSVKLFQKKHGLVQDGYFGKACLNKMKELL